MCGADGLTPNSGQRAFLGTTKPQGALAPGDPVSLRSTPTPSFGGRLREQADEGHVGWQRREAPTDAL